MNGMIQLLMQQLMSGGLMNNPAMSLYNQMMNGKNTQQQMQTILNSAKSQGMDVDAKIFSESDLKTLGLMYNPET